MAGSATAVRTTTVFRAVRLFRVLRIFKLGRYSAGMQVFYGALAHSATSLSLLGFLMAITIILFSSVMYIVEGQGDKTDQYCEDNAPNACEFRTIPTTFWWAIVTMTTVGYGDAVPFTTVGKLIASATMICGIIVIALPISVLGNNFTKLMQQCVARKASASFPFPLCPPLSPSPLSPPPVRTAAFPHSPAPPAPRAPTYPPPAGAPARASASRTPPQP